MELNWKHNSLYITVSTLDGCVADWYIKDSESQVIQVSHPLSALQEREAYYCLLLGDSPFRWDCSNLLGVCADAKCSKRCCLCPFYFFFFNWSTLTFAGIEIWGLWKCITSNLGSWDGLGLLRAHTWVYQKQSGGLLSSRASLNG